MDQPKTLAEVPEEQYRISTTELLQKQIDINAGYAKKATFTALATTLLLGGGAALTRGDTSLMFMALYGAALFPQVNFIIYNIRNKMAAKKRKKALEDGTYDEKFEESEEELRKKMLEGLKNYLAKEEEERKGMSR